MIKSRAGLILGGAALLLALSPSARKIVRNWAVKGTETVLDLTDMAKDAGAAAQSKIRYLSRVDDEMFSSDTERRF
ncbi:hypothetical protein [Cohnella terricola]|uniref:Uncharacterized protein n=1 Tax=Cohnella terricola TaxID=1289167 RepID=A0A559JWC6_9BACL|nr:hypothetical protein [Cohnella terricola]TVY04195.1 hypothetical protein FPZ45_00930 [Cohnella terricola]